MKRKNSYVRLRQHKNLTNKALRVIKIAKLKEMFEDLMPNPYDINLILEYYENQDDN